MNMLNLGSTRFVRLAALLVCLLALAAGAGADTVTLYDGSLNTTPDNQSWSYFAADSGGTPFPGTVSQSASGGATTLNSSAVNGDYAGYSNYTPLEVPLWTYDLDRAAGFTLRFEVQLTAEAHDSADRAGFSVILLGNDAKGVELGFWEDEIWAQNDATGGLFTHGEGVNYDTTVASVWYNLTILGNAYSLSVGADPQTATEILTGDVRDYSSFGDAPYTLDNYLFLGDDTTSAGATVQLANIELTNPLPEPATMILMSLGAVALLKRRT